MRLLALTSEPPQPLNHAIKRIVWNLLTRLDADVHLVTWRTPGTTDGSLDDVAERLPFTTVLPTRPLPLDRISRTRRQAKFLAGGHPPYAQAALEERNLDTESGRRRFMSFVEDLNHRGAFDVVVCFEEVMTLIPLPVMTAPRVLHRLNILTEVLEGQRKAGLAPQALWPLERPGWERFDRRTMDHVSLAVANTDELADNLRRRYPGVTVAALPTGTDIAPLPSQPEAPRDVAFIGWMSYEPNVDGVTWFAREVWPVVRRSHPTSTFRIIGRDPSPQVRALDQLPGVQVTGEVDDVVVAAQGVAVGVVPLRRGRGMKTKTLELMGMGLPTVSLPAGAEGIRATAGDGLLTVEHGHAMAKSVIELLRDPGESARRGACARRWVMDNHGWDPIAAEYAGLLSSLCDG